jgi:thiamine-monophosphate kinase
MALGEFDLIARYFSRPSRRVDVELGVGDDAAVLTVPAGMALVAATDTLVEGRHFLPGAPADSIGHQALAVNLSDLAAMGAEPAWALLSLSIPDVSEPWLEAFASGLYGLAERSGIELVGGDTVRGPLVVTVAAMGLVPRGQALRRAGAQVGDAIFVSGTLGEAAAGLQVLREDPAAPIDDSLVRRYRYAEPRLDLGRALRGQASAAMDISDGLLGDLRKVCLASGVGARIELAALPIGAPLARRFDTSACERFALLGGDDYELLFTVPRALAERWDRGGAPVGPVTKIGEIVPGEDVTCLRDGRLVEVPGGGYDHFSG